MTEKCKVCGIVGSSHSHCANIMHEMIFVKGTRPIKVSDDEAVAVRKAITEALAYVLFPDKDQALIRGFRERLYDLYPDLFDRDES